MLSNGTFLGPDEFRDLRTVSRTQSSSTVVICASADADRVAQSALRPRGFRFRCRWRADCHRRVVASSPPDGRWMMRRLMHVCQHVLRVIVCAAIDSARPLARPGKRLSSVTRTRTPGVAYQCYGDPDWNLPGTLAKTRDAFRPPHVDDFSAVASATSLQARVRTNHRWHEVSRR